jgi:hypothetical protein
MAICTTGDIRVFTTASGYMKSATASGQGTISGLACRQRVRRLCFVGSAAYLANYATGSGAQIGNGTRSVVTAGMFVKARRSGRAVTLSQNGTDCYNAADSIYTTIPSN